MENYLNSINDYNYETGMDNLLIPINSSFINTLIIPTPLLIPINSFELSNVNTYSPYIIPNYSSNISNINSGNVYSTLSQTAFSNNYYNQSNIILNDIKCKDLIYNSTKLSINNDDIKFKSELIAPYTYKYLFLYKNIKFDTILKINPINYEHFANSKFIDMVKIIENLSINEDDIEIKLICKSITNHDYFVNKVLSKKIVIPI
jgi:hypothetical protein